MLWVTRKIVYYFIIKVKRAIPFHTPLNTLYILTDHTFFFVVPKKACITAKHSQCEISDLYKIKVLCR